MTSRWQSTQPPQRLQISPLGWLRVGLRGTILSAVLILGLVALLLLRLIERPLWGPVRPVTPFITQAVCRAALVILGIRHRMHGTPMAHMGAAVANHSTWLDIFSLNARSRVYFVAKSEVARWAGIGWLARATGTVFIRRSGRDAQRQKDLFEQRLISGHRLLFFPEGTSTDGQLVLPFKSTLFAAFFTERLHPILWIQPVTVAYRAPAGQEPRFYGWWGDMALAPHLLKIMAAPRRGSVDVTYHNPLRVADFANRKDLALASENAVRLALPTPTVS